MDKRTEDMIIARAIELHRQWEARPWRVKLKGRIREMRVRAQVALRGW